MKILFSEILNITSYLVIGLVFLFLLSMFIFYITPANIISFPKANIPLAKKIYYPGQTIVVDVHYCKYQNYIGTHTITIEDGAILPGYSEMISLPLGCHEYSYNPVLIDTIPTGTYQVVIHVDYKVPFLVFAGKDTSYNFRTVPFKVINSTVTTNAEESTSSQ